MSKKIKNITIILLFFVFGLALFFGSKFYSVKGLAFVGDNPTLSDKDLFNATNTFNVSDDLNSFDEEDGTFLTSTDTTRRNQTQYNLFYNLDAQNYNRNNVMDYAQITVLTHGLDSRASVWSNKYDMNTFDPNDKNDQSFNFAYDEDSLISKIDEAVGGANIYWAKMEESKNQFKLYNLTNVISENVYNTNQLPEEDFVCDLSKHIIIIFEADEIDGSNANVYYEFNYMLSKIIYDVSINNPEQKLPKVNLIGHSRGGLTNLQYALDHPHLVSTLISLGTPYLGSFPAEKFGNYFTKACDGFDDIINPEIYGEYKERWNTHYDALYKDIEVYAFGSYQTIDSLYQSLNNYKRDKIGEKDKDDFYIYLSLASFFKDMSGIALPLIRDMFEDFLETILPLEENSQEIIENSIVFDELLMEASFFGDLAVDISSQFGYSGETNYMGFNTYVRRFTVNDKYLDFNKISQDTIPVAHNLIARDKIVIANVVSKLDLGGEKPLYITIKKDDGTLSIVGANQLLPEDVTIPATIDGAMVTEIGPFAFSEQSNLVNVYAPASIKEIGAFAFSGCESLERFVLNSQNPSLVEIGTCAFANCYNMKEFCTENTGTLLIPNSVQRIHSKAFYGTGFSEVRIGEGLAHVGEGAFSKNQNLTNIRISSENNQFISKDNCLIDNNNNIIQYLIGKTDTSFSLTNLQPDSKYNIGVFAFSGANNLQTVNLQGVYSIRESAFADCQNLTSIQNDTAVEHVGVGAFDESVLTYDSNGFCVIGRVLYKYNGTASMLNKTGFVACIETIASLAFYENECVQTITLPDTVSSILPLAFSSCQELDKVQYEGNVLSSLAQTAFMSTNDSFKFYCRKEYVDSYQDDELLSEILEPIKTEVLFKYFDQEIMQVFYLGEPIAYPEIDFQGYHFFGWSRLDEETNALSDEYLFAGLPWEEAIENATYMAELIEEQEYVVNFYNGNVFVGGININDGDAYSFGISTYTINGETKEYDGAPLMDNSYYNCYYGPKVVNGVQVATFGGWYSESVQYTDGVWAENVCPNNLYACWAPALFTLSFDFVGGQSSITSLSYNFGQEISLSQEIVKEGYRFMGWEDVSGKRYNSTLGIVGDVVLYAIWAEVYTVTLIAQEYVENTQYSFTGILNETFILPELTTETHLVVSWDTHKVGDEYVITSTITLYAVWEGKEFAITYQNLTFMGETAYIAHCNNTNLVVPISYKYGQIIRIYEFTPIFDELDPYAPKILFINWCTDPELTTELEIIDETIQQDLVLYAKYRYDFGYGSRVGEFTVTNAGQMNQEYDSIYIGLSDQEMRDELIRVGIKKLAITFSIKMKEIEDGTQYIYFYGGPTGKTLLESYTYNVTSTATVKTINLEFEIDQIGAIDFIYVRYNASTSGWWLWEQSDNWKNIEIYYETSYLTQSADKQALTFSWAYQNPF